jgi:hypothetical protein
MKQTRILCLSAHGWADLHKCTKHTNVGIDNLHWTAITLQTSNGKGNYRLLDGCCLLVAQDIAQGTGFKRSEM